MPTYLNVEGRLVQTGTSMGIRSGWMGLVASESRGWKSSFTPYLPTKNTENDVLVGMGVDINTLTLISSLPQSFPHSEVAFVEVIEITDEMISRISKKT